MIKAVIFDVDGVLLDSFEANFTFYQNLMKAAGYTAPTRKKLQLFSYTKRHTSLSRQLCPPHYTYAFENHIKNKIEILAKPF